MTPHLPRIHLATLDQCSTTKHDEALHAMPLYRTINKRIHGRDRIGSFGGDEVDGGDLLAVGEFVLEGTGESGGVSPIKFCDL